MENKQTPVVLAWPTESSKQVKVWCPYCQKWHYHGSACEGHRLPHCTKNTPFSDTGYDLKFVNSDFLKKD